MPNKEGNYLLLNEKKHVLLVEDEMVNQEIMKAILGDVYNLTVVDNGEEALEVVAAQFETISIVLLDLNLPGIKGVKVLQKIKETPAYAHLPVIVMTADADAEVECLTIGALDFIPKPYPKPQVILARIQRIIELSEDRDILHWTERDRLTGLYNKEFFYAYSAQLDMHHKNTPTDAVVLDINHFHTINDRYGKTKGDEILKNIGGRALSLARDVGGIVCRSGADTFMIYCPHATGYEKLLDVVSIPVDENDNSDNKVRLRMGVYPDVDKTLDIERRFDRAKMAADSVKGIFTTPIGYFDNAMREKEMLEEQLIDDFPTALKEKQFLVYYQPKFGIQGGEPRLYSAEALVRWRHPKLGLVSPGVFIPLFEKNGLIQKLDYYVWLETAARIKKWKMEKGIELPVSVNVSRIDLYAPELVPELKGLVDENSLKYEDLILEITESAYTENSEKIIEKVKQLRDLGFRIEMDDFGSGYSSLSMLSYLPIDALKIDMQFIRNAFNEKNDTRLLEAIIQLAAALEVPTIAEGVETEEQYKALKKMGCHFIQGYYFMRPLPVIDFEKYIEEKAVRE